MNRQLLLVAVVAIVARVGWEMQIGADQGPIETISSHLLGDERAYHEMALDFSEGTLQRERAFYQEPLYSWFLSKIYTLAPPPRSSEMNTPPFAPVHETIIWLQHLAGVLTAVLVASLGTRIFGKGTGTLAGLFAAVSGPAIFYESMLLKSAFALLVTTAVLHLWLSLWQQADDSRPGNGKALLLGVICGVGILLRGNLYLLLLAIVTTLLLSRPSQKRALRSAGLVLLGGLCALLPTTLFNTRHGDFVLTTYQSGSNAVIGQPDNEDILSSLFYTPLIPGQGDARFEETDAVSLAEAATGQSLKGSEVSSYWWGEWWERTLRRPFVTLTRMGTKALMTFHGEEIPDVKDWQFTRQAVPILATPLSDFSLLGPLALLGFFLLPWRGRGGSVLRISLLVGASSLALFYVMGRYRLSVAPALWIFSAGIIYQGWRAWMSGSPAQRLGLATLSLAFVLLGMTVHQGALSLRPDVRGAQAFQVSWSNYATIELAYARTVSNPATAAEHQDRAVIAAHEAVRLAPLFPAGHATLLSCLDLRRPDLPPPDAKADLAAWRLLLVLLGQEEGVDVSDTLDHQDVGSLKRETRTLLTQHVTGNRSPSYHPTLAHACRRSSQSLKQESDQPLALVLLDLASRTEPGVGLTEALRGQAHKRLGQLPQAAQAYRQAIALGEDSLEIRNNLGNILIGFEQPEEALKQFEAALRLAPGNPTVLRNIERARTSMD